MSPDCHLIIIHFFDNLFGSAGIQHNLSMATPVCYMSCVHGSLLGLLSFCLLTFRVPVQSPPRPNATYHELRETNISFRWGVERLCPTAARGNNTFLYRMVRYFPNYPY